MGFTPVFDCDLGFFPAVPLPAVAFNGVNGLRLFRNHCVYCVADSNRCMPQRFRCHTGSMRLCQDTWDKLLSQHLDN
jgi:hypothetical protein